MHGLRTASEADLGCTLRALPARRLDARQTPAWMEMGLLRRLGADVDAP